jgi:hypothetical protein
MFLIQKSSMLAAEVFKNSRYILFDIMPPFHTRTMVTSSFNPANASDAYDLHVF